MIVREFLRKTIYNRSWVLDLILVATLAVTIMFLVGQRNQTEQLKDLANANKTLNTQNKQILDQIISCTDPKGVCSVLNQKRSSGVVENINKVTLFAAYCASKTPPYASVDDVRKCVEDAITGKEPIVTK
jgi:tRNA G18 (ribose-2'-O)-methylase SpoU